MGFDVNARPRTTALHEAALRGNMPLIALLVELGADRTIVDTEFNSTPSGWADHGGNPDAARYLEQLDASTAPVCTQPQSGVDKLNTTDWNTNVSVGILIEHHAPWLTR